MIGSGASAGAEDDLIRAARAFRQGKIDQEELLRLVEVWAVLVPGGSPERVVSEETASAAISVGQTGPDRQAVEEKVEVGRSDDPAADSMAPTSALESATDLNFALAPALHSSLASVSESAEMVRFAVLGVHAEGGLGTVYRAIDAEVGREVALKQIRADRADDPESRARFEREGAITGALEHPGIVPVYGRGRFDDGRPYFAMRLVRGRSLREAIADLHRSPAPERLEAERDDPGSDATLRALVGRLVQACFAVEYAHSRGVVHRDLKPENILLGPFGETLVVDWGLAGATEPPGRSPEPRPERGEPGTIGQEPGEETIGTTRHPGPSPLAWVEETVTWIGDPGLLVGVSGVGSGDSWETRIGHVRGTIAYMSPEQARGEHDRVGPRSDVYGLGASLYCLLTGRAPISSEGGVHVSLEKAIRGEVEPPGEVCEGVDPDLERICRKAMDPDPDRRFPTARALAEALDEWLAEERARTARALFSSALEAYAALVTTVEDRLGTMPAAREAREDLLATAVTGLEGLIEHAEQEQSAEVERALAEAHRQLGEISLRLGRSGEARRHFERSLRAFETLVRAGKPEAVDRRGLAVVLGRLGDVSRRRGDASGARRYYRRGLVAARALAAIEPRSGRAQRGLAIAYSKLGDLARQSGDPASARSYHRRSLAIADALARAAPEAADTMRSVAMALDKLGDVERQMGDLEAARRYYRRALSVAETLAEARPEDFSASRGVIISGNKLGELDRLAGDLDAARKAFERSMALAEAQAEADPGDVDARRDLAICCDRLGDVCRRAGDLEAAARHYVRGLGLARSLLAADPESAQARRGTSIALNKLADLRRQAGDLDGAGQAHREALGLIEAMADSAPDDAQAQIDVAFVCHRLGDLETLAGRAEAARGWFDRALDRLRPLAARDCLPPSCGGWIEILERLVEGPGRPTD